MTKWAYLGVALALAAVAGVTGQLWWAASAAVMLATAGVRLVNDRRRAREAAQRDEGARHG
jgi:Flp pilus assembly protein TadB